MEWNVFLCDFFWKVLLVNYKLINLTLVLWTLGVVIKRRFLFLSSFFLLYYIKHFERNNFASSKIGVEQILVIRNQLKWNLIQLLSVVFWGLSQSDLIVTSADFSADSVLWSLFQQSFFFKYFFFTLKNLRRGFPHSSWSLRIL